MKRAVLVIIAVLLAMPSFAQMKIVEVRTQADTLLYTAPDMTVLEFYKNPNGYFLREQSSNYFDLSPSFYLGETKEQTIESLNLLISLCDNDTGTTFRIKDALEREFFGVAGYMASITRKPTPVIADRIHIKNDQMRGAICIRKKALENIIKFLN